jgi:SAM-dependent methyltransferase
MLGVPEPLYGPAQSEALCEREEYWEQENRRKFDVLLENLDGCRRLVDIGCGWGQLLRMARRHHVPEVWGVDESPHRLSDTRATCPEARVVQCRADRLALPDDYFDVAVTSQMLHEVKLFGTPGELARVLGEIRRVLADGGRYLLLDHRDAGEGDVVVELPSAATAELAHFEREFKFCPARHEDAGAGAVRMSRRCLQDFLTKTWAFGGPMEGMEMNETHNVFDEAETVRLVESAGFDALDWVLFSDIRLELARVGGRLLDGEPWARKFLLIAQKTS